MYTPTSTCARTIRSSIVEPPFELIAGGVLALALDIALSVSLSMGNVSLYALACSAFLLALHGIDVHRLVLSLLLLTSRGWHRHLGGDVGGTTPAYAKDSISICRLTSGGAFALVNA